MIKKLNVTITKVSVYPDRSGNPLYQAPYVFTGDEMKVKREGEWVEIYDGDVLKAYIKTETVAVITFNEKDPEPVQYTLPPISPIGTPQPTLYPGQIVYSPSGYGTGGSKSGN